MKAVKTLLIIFCVFITSNIYAGTDKTKKQCDPEIINKFKTDYLALQEKLKYDDNDPETTLAKTTEKVLLNNYRNALYKVGKIYQHLKEDPTFIKKKKDSKSNDDVTNFFKAIEDNNTKTANVNIAKLLNYLETVKVPNISDDEKLNSNDKYLLEKLLIHSQDRICTLTGYINKSKNTEEKKYLNLLKKSPLNLMIKSLQKGNIDKLQFSKEDITINSAIEESLAKLREKIKDNSACIALLKAKSLNNKAISDFFGTSVQSCNFKHFLNSLFDDTKYKNFETILHFINANQNSKNKNDLTVTDADLASTLPPPPKKEEKQTFASAGDSEEKKCTDKNEGKTPELFTWDATATPPCKDNKKECTDIKKMDWNNEKGCIDNKASCEKKQTDLKAPEGNKELFTWDTTSTPAICLDNKEKCKNDGKNWDDKTGCINKVETIKTCNEAVKIYNEETKQCVVDCADVIVEETDGKTCKKPSKEVCEKNSDKDLTGYDEKDKKCTISPKLKECNDAIAKATEAAGGYLTPGKIYWDSENHKCVDKIKSDSDGDGETTGDEEDYTIIDNDPNKKAPGRFQPISMPNRQPFILPGMP